MRAAGREPAPREVKVGAFFRVANPPPWERDWHQFYEDTLDQIRLAEDVGFDAVTVTEHHFAPDGYMPAPMTFEAAIAAVTKRVDICSYVLLLPMYHPLRLAEEAAVVDILSGGRLILGLGLGYRWEEFEAFGVDRRHSGRVANEALEVLIGAMTQDSFSFSGDHFQLTDVTMTPKPYRKPRPPIWMGSPTTPASMRRVAKFGLDGFAGTPSPEMYQVYLAACEQAGTKPIARGQSLMFGHCAVDADTAWQEARRPAQWAWSLYRNWWWTFGDTRHMTGELRNQRLFRFGDPQMWTDWVVESITDAPATSHVIVGLQLPGLSHEAVMRSIELFGSEVLPRVRERVREGALAGRDE